MTKKELCIEIGNISDKFIEEAYQDVDVTQRKSHCTMWGSLRQRVAFACMILIIGATVMIMMSRETESDVQLMLSQGNVSAKYIDRFPDNIKSYSLDYFYTEDEIFTKYDTTIFKGKIKAIRNLEINFNGSIEYRAVAEIEVIEVYRGGCSVGSTVTVLTPCPINVEGYWVEDTEVASCMREGMTGIFAPVKCDETFYTKERQTVFYWQDVAEYGFLNGMNTMFLEDGDNLIFDRYVYESIADAQSLGEIEAYVKDMVAKYDDE